MNSLDFFGSQIARRWNRARGGFRWTDASQIPNFRRRAGREPHGLEDDLTINGLVFTGKS